MGVRGRRRGLDGGAVTFEETVLKGSFIVGLERREDERGFFARAFCQEEFSARGLDPVVAQANVGYSHRKGTLRGMHFQFPPRAEAKLVRATRGAILDVGLGVAVSDACDEAPDLVRVAVYSDEDHGPSPYAPDAAAHAPSADR